MVEVGGLHNETNQRTELQQKSAQVESTLLLGEAATECAQVCEFWVRLGKET